LYFKKGEGLGIYTLLQVWGRLKCPLVHIVISNDVPAYVVKYERTHVHTYSSTYLGMVGYVVKYVRTHVHTHVSTYLGMVEYVDKYVRTHVHTYVSTYLGMVGYVVVFPHSVK
jgi:hypothetical protein